MEELLAKLKVPPDAAAAELYQSVQPLRQMVAFQAAFVRDHLGPVLRGEHPHVKIIGFDHNKVRVWGARTLGAHARRAHAAHARPRGREELGDETQPAGAPHG